MRLRWPWRQENGEEQVKAAKQQLDNARRQLQRTLQTEPEVHRTAAELRKIRQQNQFGAMILDSMKGVR